MNVVRRFDTGLSLAIFAASAYAADFPSAAPESPGFSSERLTRVGSVIKREIGKEQVPLSSGLAI